MLAPITELHLGPSQGWVDISGDVRVQTATSGGGISITRGRQREGGQADPGSLGLTLDNRSGRYSPRNPASDLHGLIGRNTPIRVRVPDAGDGYLEWYQGGEHVTTPYTADMAITAIDARVDVEIPAQPGAWVPLIGRWPHSTTAGWMMSLSATGRLRGWVITGTGRVNRAGEAPSPVVMTGRTALRMVYVGNDGGDRLWQFYQGPALAGPWTLLSSTRVTGGAETPSSSTAPLMIGCPATFAEPAASAGRIYAAEVRSGIDGPVIASLDLRAAAAAAPGSVITAGGRPWTLSRSAAVRAPGVRISAEVSEWPARWDLSGADRWTPVTAAGILRRLGQGARPLHSPLRRHLDRYSPIAYLPLEDGSDADRPSSAVAGTAAATWREVAAGSDDAPPGASSAVQLTAATSRIALPVPATPASAPWGLIFAVKFGALPATETEVMRIDVTGGAVARWVMSLGPYRDAVGWTGYDAAGGEVARSWVFNSSFDALSWTSLHFGVEQHATAQALLFSHRVGGADHTSRNLSHAGAIGSPRQVTVNGLAGVTVSLSHLAVVDRWLPFAEPSFYSIAAGYRGERAAERMVRLSAEQGVPLVVSGVAPATEPMGPQRPETYLDLMRECAEADGGILGEARDLVALEYRPRTALYNQQPVTLSYAAGLVGDGIDPTDDDSDVTNSVEVQRVGGGSARAELESGRMSTLPPPAGVGVYDSSVTLSLADDGRLPDHAGWRLHLGTVDELRYPTVPLRLHSPRWAAVPVLRSQVARMESGDVAELVGLPEWATGDGRALVMVQGYTETIESHRWDITWTTSPGSPWTVAAGGSDRRIAARGTTLEEPLTLSGMSVWMVSVPANGPWTTDASNMPLLVRLERGGLFEVIRVSAITGTSYSQQLTISHRGLNGVQRAWPVGTRVDIWQPGIVAL